MANKVKVSEQFSLPSILEWVKAMLKSVGIVVLVELQKYLDAGNLNIDWKQLAMIAVGAFITFLGVKTISKPSVTTTYDTNEKANKVAETIKAD